MSHGISSSDGIPLLSHNGGFVCAEIGRAQNILIRLVHYPKKLATKSCEGFPVFVSFCWSLYS